MKKVLCISMLVLLLTGCYNYRDVNLLVFVTSLGIDIDENNKTILYAEAFTSLRAVEQTGSEGRIVFRGSGDTLYEAIRNLFASSAFRVNFTQNKAIIFSERAAKYGLDNFLDVLIRNEELLVRQYLYISKIELEELMKIKLQEEKYLGTFLAELSKNTPAITIRPQMRIDEFLIYRKLGSKINTISVIEKDPDALVDRLFLKHLAVMKEDKFIAELDYYETFYYNIVMDNLRAGFINIQNPTKENKVTNLEILKNKTKTHIDYDGETVDVKKEISMRTVIAHTEEVLHVRDKKERAKLSKYAEEYIHKGCQDLYTKYKDMDIDIFNLKKDIDIKYPHANIDDDLNYVNLFMKYNIYIEGSPDMTDFY